MLSSGPEAMALLNLSLQSLCLLFPLPCTVMCHQTQSSPSRGFEATTCALCVASPFILVEPYPYPVSFGPFMLALCSMLPVSNYAQNYASRIYTQSKLHNIQSYQSTAVPYFITCSPYQNVLSQHHLKSYEGLVKHLTKHNSLL